MSATALLAALAGAAAAAGVVDLAAAWARRAVRPRAGPGRALVAALARIGAPVRPAAPRDLPARLDAAGLDVAVADVMAIKAGGAPAALLAVPALAPALPGRLGVLLWVVAPLAGFLAPDVWLRRRARRRGEAMVRELADVLELLRVAAGAGLAGRRALAEVGRRHPGLLAAELRRAAGAAELGVPLDAALEKLERRCPCDGVAGLAAALRRAARHGAPLAGTLAAQAEEARSRQARRTLEAGARAAPKIQLVVALLLVPSVMLLVAAALVPALGAGAP